MIWTKMTINAAKQAYEAHKDQEDKLGAPYFCHLMCVAERCPDEVTAAMGLLHDLAEDDKVWRSCHKTLFISKMMDEFGLPEKAAERLWLLKHPENMSYTEYIRRLCDSGNRLALIVKKADLENNMDPNRLALIDSEATVNRLRKKYSAAYLSILAALETAPKW